MLSETNRKYVDSKILSLQRYDQKMDLSFMIACVLKRTLVQIVDSPQKVSHEHQIVTDHTQMSNREIASQSMNQRDNNDAQENEANTHENEGISGTICVRLQGCV